MPLVPPGIGVRSPRSRPLRGAGDHARFLHNEFQLLFRRLCIRAGIDEAN